MLDENIPLVSAAERDNNIDEDSKNQSEENGSTLRLVIPPLIIFATVVTILTFIAVVFVIARDSPSAHYRTDCYPDALSKFSNYSKEACRKRHCWFDERANLSGTQCYMNDNYGYLFEGEEKTQNGIQIKLKRTQAHASMFPEPIDNVILDVQYYTDDIIRFKLYDSDNQRYEVPIPLAQSSDHVSNPQYQFKHTSHLLPNNLFSFTIKRRASERILFDTGLGGLVLNNQFLQIVTRLQSPHIYGFGENNHDTLKHNVYEQKTWGIFARDQGTNWGTNTNHYGSHPFYVVMEEIPNSNSTPSGHMHGVLLLNSNAMDYSLRSTPSLTIRTIGGILDFFMFLGPTPEQVIQQYTWLIGRSILPPYWSLGFQISRYGYSDVEHMEMVTKRNRLANVPFDVQYADIDYMDSRKAFTIDPIHFGQLKKYFSQLNQDGIRTMIILDPGMIDDKKYYQPTIDGIQEDVFIRWNQSKTLIKGVCWPGDVFYPDFFVNQTQTWWSRWINNFRKVNLTFDGLWIDMNEPALFSTNDPVPWNSGETGSNYTLKCSQNQFDDPPYRTKAVFRFDNDMDRSARLSDHTLCMSALQGEINSRTNQSKYRHYDVHNLYGWSETKATWNALRSTIEKRSLILSRSTFVGSGQWSSHWFGDNQATWNEMKRSIILMIEFNWFGIPFNGADICGFEQIPTEELCIRWMQLGAFYPFSRSHSSKKPFDQDPASWSKPTVSIMVSALRIRYILLPYYYTLFYKAHTQGSTVIRPLFHEYPTDKITLDIYLQFLIGSSIMIAPVTDDGLRQVRVYIPSSHWYDYYTGSLIQAKQEFVTVNAPLETIPIFLRGGAIIPTQGYASNTKYSRMKPFGLIVVLNADGQAAGDLFYDDGESFNTIDTQNYYYALFTWSSKDRQLSINVTVNNYSYMSTLVLDSLTIYGWNQIPTTIHIDNKYLHKINKSDTQLIRIEQLSMIMNKSHIITWDEIKNNNN
ncbi:unnamed protein product [Adineta steineri]|uniref:Uncharacterized protein n=1 Tax=Adineta steineri TaxID=433720 RepID=A0A819FIV2_9BILA|nr:unnamed protein product [Adineta steineri]CAF3869258.1 unnamed protein product [Adineta steineri]